MNKLTALYTAMKHMKEIKTMDGKMDVEITFGETILATANGEAVCEAGKCSKKFEMQFGDESMKFERSGKLQEGCCEGLHHFHGHGFGHGHGMQHRQATGCCGHGSMKKDKLGQVMFFLKVLDQVQFDDAKEGLKTLSLEMTMADCPEGIKAHMESHLAHKRAHLKAVMACGTAEECCSGMKDECHVQGLEWLKTNGLCHIDPDSIMPEKMHITLALNQEGKPIEMTSVLTIQTKLTTGESKALRFNMHGKML